VTSSWSFIRQQNTWIVYIHRSLRKLRRTGSLIVLQVWMNCKSKWTRNA